MAGAQAINDPMRPPGPLATREADARGDPEPAAGALVLQSVILSSTLQAAIIGGQMVRLGESYGDAVLVEVAENQVVLKRGGMRQVLKMYPGVDKREVAPSPRRAPR